MMYYWRRNIKQMLREESYHNIYLFKRNSLRISLSQLSISYILRENSLSKGKILDNKNFTKLLTNQKFCLSGELQKNGHKDGLSRNLNQLRFTFLFLCLKWLF